MPAEGIEKEVVYRLYAALRYKDDDGMSKGEHDKVTS